MNINIVTHINLRGNARAALEFYRSVFGGDLLAAPARDGEGPLGSRCVGPSAVGRLRRDQLSDTAPSARSSRSVRESR